MKNNVFFCKGVAITVATDAQQRADICKYCNENPHYLPVKTKCFVKDGHFVTIYNICTLTCYTSEGYTKVKDGKC